MNDGKAQARKAAFARRKAAHAEAVGDRTGPLRELLGDHVGRVTSGYMPILSEIDPRPAMAQAALSAPVGVPVIRGAGQPLVFSRWTPETKMIEGPFRALVPEVEDLVVPQVLIVPLVAFTARGERLGYGGGFYDRTLQLLRSTGSVFAIGFAYAAQETDALPADEHDQHLDAIVTERGVAYLT